MWCAVRHHATCPVRHCEDVNSLRDQASGGNAFPAPCFSVAERWPQRRITTVRPIHLVEKEPLQVGSARSRVIETMEEEAERDQYTVGGEGTSKSGSMLLPK